MTTSKRDSAPAGSKAGRSERLAAQLRANLRRRKAQLRARKTPEKPSSSDK
jgi:hypothetical protein